ncbi:MAG TPA: adenosylcobinamide-GDP ribazoletransferase [Bacteroidota bacterium]|nr:adenosylcobinamide-GDP ribazoletransferase [Bacteroidota bacterium]
MRRHIDAFFAAVMFFTRIPVPQAKGDPMNLLQDSAKFFPWVGLIVGGIAAVILLGAGLVVGPALAVLISMTVSILTTGAFHEDGFADVCDAFGGGWTKEKILVIMKDSRLGTYGVVGLILILSMKFALLIELLGHGMPWRMAAVLIAAHSVSRFMGVTLMQGLEYVTDADASKSKPIATRRLTASGIGVAALGALLPFVFLPAMFLAAIIPAAAARAYLGLYFRKWIGGYTGDCAGATQQVCEIMFYIGAELIWKFC